MEENQRSKDQQRIITLLLNEQFELRSSVINSEILEEDDLITDSLTKGEQIVSRMDKTIGSIASLFSGAHTTIDELNNKLEEATNNKVDNTIDSLKKDKMLLQNAIGSINQVGDMLKLANGIQERIGSVNTFDECVNLLQDCIKIYQFMNDRKEYQFYSAHEIDTKNHLQIVYDKTLVFYNDLFVEISKPESVSQILSKESYIGTEYLQMLKKAMPIIFEAGTLLRANAHDVFAVIFENRKEYLLEVIQSITLPVLTESDEVVEYTVGYTNGKNAFITTMKHVLSLFQNERIFQQDILQNDFDKFFVGTTDEPFTAFIDLYTSFVSTLQTLDTPFIVFPLLDILEVYENMKADFTNALKINEDPKNKSKGFIALEKGFNVLTSSFTFGSDKKEDDEEEDDLYVEDTTGDKRDSQTKRVDALFDTMYTNVKTLLIKFRDEVLIDSTLNKIFSWTESSIPVDGTVSQLAADTMHYLSKLEKYLPQLSSYISRMYREENKQNSNGTEDEGYVGMFVDVCIQNLCQMIEARASKEKSRLGKIFKINNYAFIMNVCMLDGFEKLFGSSLQKKIESDFTTKKENAIHEYKDSLQSIYETLNARPSKSEQIKKAFTSFNKDFQALHTVSSGYSVYNDQLKEELRSVLKEQILEPYTLFYNNYEKVKFTQNPTKYFLYTPQMVEQCIKLMFEAKTDVNGESKELTDYIPDFLQNVPHFVPKMSTITSLATPLQNLPQHLKNLSHKPVDIVKETPKVIKNPLKSTKKFIKNINPF
ncbi:exocyst complex component exo70, putative [Entamoeba histolytica HM-1:IMSS-B]|uniref:Exocyst subunit Exo70 family protein n=6 Tax=Entamoeba histolytica TaxID=5759 RepID=C4LW49_ENTH1|nr:exocyst complex component exo70, putative [Entamoeba histolytica HM-1:IMSS]EMD42437.1 exocyst complex component exo70, putative [Entamoeba histolytica KU27]EMH72878.1 exocyst complex component exo70, putative [Entamoeba histolytica HM-1:IMSS-B]EMS12441.1 exocyst complex component exo70, putative [Entamoeba histolytica HM-3:IMSS]ENY62937.1 exocyst complex component exo70, putative [Entamoeba histolytica HM-1:IMSS-A]GAT92922.1 exocyst complex component exo70 putative [Entamoeba histolytica]|eukprot:XP_650775.1 exocyst complex component exo70, putative [Entamoeba histolytica HM-1:IMSS]